MKLRRKRLLLSLAGTCAALLATGSAAWVLAPYCVDDPMIELARQTPVRSWYDRNGELLWHERTYDSQWRFPVPREKISPHAVRVILAAEDASFHEHSGVDYAAVCRALWQNVTSGRRISGASTISMQLAGMSMPPGRHDLRRKFIQAAKARKLERLHSKEEILTEYLNRIPFGGKLHGLEAASRYYFGLPASELNLSEATFLCGLPQKPNFLRPDRHPERARERQRIVLKLLTRRGKLTPAEAKRILEEEPPRLRDFRYRASFESAASPGEFFHAFAMSGHAARTTLDRELHFRILSLLRAQRQRLKNVRDGAALLIDNRSGEALVYLGTLNFAASGDGEVDVVRAIRSAGSSLKPFIYAEAISGGQLVEATRILDAPIRFGDYSPGNYDGKFHGAVRAGFALSHSLNTPAVRLVAQLGEKRVKEAFIRSGLSNGRSDDRAAGLSLALGTEGYSLWEIARAYAMLATGGAVVEPTLSKNAERKRPATRAFSPEVCLMVSLMLRARPFGHSDLDVAWKTGTSNNNCDAWCFAYTPDYTLGVWFGNKNGERSSDLVGATAALPVACEIFELLYRGQVPPHWPDTEKTLERRELCDESGLTPGVFCKRRSLQLTIPHLPLAGCRSCTPAGEKPFYILSPAPKQYRLPPGQNTVKLKLRAAGSNISWYLNGRPIGQNLAEYDFPGNARHTLRALETSGDPGRPPRSAEVTFSVTGDHR